MAALDTDETCCLAEHRQAEAPSLASPCQLEETEPMEEPAPHSYDGKDEADQHQHKGAPHPGGNPAWGMTQSETSDADTLGPCSAPHPAEEGDSSTRTSWQISNGMEGAKAEQTRQYLEIRKARHLADAPVTNEDIMVDLIHRAKRPATAHILSTRKPNTTGATKKHKDQKKKLRKPSRATIQQRNLRKKWMTSVRSTEEGLSKEVTFNALAHAFKLDDRITDLFLKGPMENLQDFRYYFAEKKELETFVAAALTTGTLNEDQWRNKAHHKQLWVQIMRAKDAWTTTRRICQQQENHIADASREANNLIEIHTLRAAKLRFLETLQDEAPNGGKPI